jgi:hypothetical protein
VLNPADTGDLEGGWSTEWETHGLSGQSRRGGRAITPVSVVTIQFFSNQEEVVFCE